MAFFDEDVCFHMFPLLWKGALRLRCFHEKGSNFNCQFPLDVGMENKEVSLVSPRLHSHENIHSFHISFIYCYFPPKNCHKTWSLTHQINSPWKANTPSLRCQVYLKYLLHHISTNLFRFKKPPAKHPCMKNPTSNRKHEAISTFHRKSPPKFCHSTTQKNPIHPSGGRGTQPTLGP